MKTRAFPRGRPSRVVEEIPVELTPKREPTVQEKLEQASARLVQNIKADPVFRDLGLEVMDPSERAFIRSPDLGVKAFWIATGGHVEESSIREQVFEVARDEVGFHLREFEDRLMYEPGAVTLMEEAGVAAMNEGILQRVFRVLVAASTVEAPVKSKMRQMKVLNARTLASVSQRTDTPGDVIVFGNQASLVGVREDDYYDQQFSVRKVTVNGPLAIQMPDDKVWAVNADEFRFILWDTNKTKVWVENENWFQHWQHNLDVGIVAVFALELGT